MSHARWSQLVVVLAIRNRSTLRDVYSPFGDSMVMVNRHGRRVMNEKATYNERGQVHYHWDAGLREYPNYLIFWILTLHWSIILRPHVFAFRSRRQMKSWRTLSVPQHGENCVMPYVSVFPNSPPAPAV